MASAPAPDRQLSATDCPCCWEELNETRIPYSLTCGHTLCIICIKRLGQNSPQFHCPLCREIVPLNSVKRNFTLLQLLTQLKKSSGGGADFLNPALTTSFDSIRFDTLLDRGASGEVHRGSWQSNDVAIKIFASGQLTPEIQDSFRREVCVMSTLRHPNVVLLLAACPTPPRLAIVMEFVGGGSLYSHLYINKTPLEFVDTVKLLIDVSRGLQYLHSINILHRDLKSKNVLLTAAPPNCQAKLCDFGLARMRLESVTMTGNIGTVHWTAPEVLNCARYHFPADVYGLGMVIYEVIARAIPFNGLPPPTVIVAVLLRREKPKIPAGCNEDLTALCERCLSWEANDRPSIYSVLSTLSSLMPEVPLPSSDSNDDDVFDHTDSLGHVVMEVEFDETDLDSDLMDFLMASQNENAEEDSSSSNTSVGTEDDLKDFDSPLFVPVTASTGTNSNNDINDKDNGGGALSTQELDDIREQSLTASYSSSESPYLSLRSPSYSDIHVERGGPALSQQYQPIYHPPPPPVESKKVFQPQQRPKPVQKSSLDSRYLRNEPLPKPTSKIPLHPKHPVDSIRHPLAMAELSRVDLNPAPSINEYSSVRLESGGIMNWNDEENRTNQTIQHAKSSSSATEEEDFEMARALMLEERAQQLKSDYQIASILQKQYEQSNAPNIKPSPLPKPPPPPPALPSLQLPLQQLPFMPSTKQLLSTTGRLRKLNPVTPPREKRGVKLGKVVGGIPNDRATYTVQNEIRNFSRRLLSPVELREPYPPYPVGRVVDIKPYSYVRGMVKKINESIESFDKTSMIHVMYLEKNPLPTAEDIELERAQGSNSDPESYARSRDSSVEDEVGLQKRYSKGSESNPETKVMRSEFADNSDEDLPIKKPSKLKGKKRSSPSATTAVLKSKITGSVSKQLPSKEQIEQEQPLRKGFRQKSPPVTGDGPVSPVKKSTLSKFSLTRKAGGGTKAVPDGDELSESVKQMKIGGKKAAATNPKQQLPNDESLFIGHRMTEKTSYLQMKKSKAKKK